MSLLVQDIIQMAEKQLMAARIDNPKGDAEEIYCRLMHVDRAKFFMEWSEPAADRTCEQFFDMVARRAQHEPLQYIVGSQGFLDFDLKVRPGVLIPRLDTEVVADKACGLLRSRKGDTVLEIGCGSGAISIALAKKANAKVTAVDINPEACELTKENAGANGARVEVLCGDMFEPVKKKKFHMIVSNPPYIPTDEIPTLDIEVQREPHLALDGGKDGLDLYRAICVNFRSAIKEGGALMFEVGLGQYEDVRKIMLDAGFEDITIFKDLTGIERVVCGTVPYEVDECPDEGTEENRTNVAENCSI
jgi:release factor glutamine methyltransferase